MAWGFLANEINQIENNREPELLHTHVMALSSIHGARTFPRQGRAQYVCLKYLKVFLSESWLIDGLRKAGDAPGHKIVVAVCVCVFVVVVVVVVVVGGSC